MRKKKKEKGIKNLSEVKIENDNGEIETKDFYSLTKEEQLSILNDTPIIEDKIHIYPIFSSLSLYLWNNKNV